MSEVVDQAIESVAGKSRIRGGELILGLRNTILDEFVSRVEQAGLATTEDAFLSIAPLFRKLSQKSLLQPKNFQIWQMKY